MIQVTFDHTWPHGADKLTRALNGLLPHDISVVLTEEVRVNMRVC
jgi:hypothetical protein